MAARIEHEDRELQRIRTASWRNRLTAVSMALGIAALLCALVPFFEFTRQLFGIHTSWNQPSSYFLGAMGLAVLGVVGASQFASGRQKKTALVVNVLGLGVGGLALALAFLMAMARL